MTTSYTHGTLLLIHPSHDGLTLLHCDMSHAGPRLPAIITQLTRFLRCLHLWHEMLSSSRTGTGVVGDVIVVGERIDRGEALPRP